MTTRNGVCGTQQREMETHTPAIIKWLFWMVLCMLHILVGFVRLFFFRTSTPYHTITWHGIALWFDIFASKRFLSSFLQDFFDIRLVCFSWVSHAYTHFMYDFVASMCILYVTCRALMLLLVFSCAPYRLFHFCPRWNKSQSNSKEQVAFGCRFKIDRVVHYNFHCDSFVYISIYYCDFVHTHTHQPTYTHDDLCTLTANCFL